MKVVYGSYSYFTVEQCQDSPDPESCTLGKSPQHLSQVRVQKWSRHTLSGTSAPIATTLCFHELLFFRTNVSGNGSSLIDTGANGVGRVDNS